MDKEKLLKIALSTKSVIKPYADTMGADEAEKFLIAHNIKAGRGVNVPVSLVYYYYYLWSKNPLDHVMFYKLMGKYHKSDKFRVNSLRITYRAYRWTTFPEYTAEDELKARRLLDGQKENYKKKKQRKQAKKLARKQESSSQSES